jgi:hypothetical protein
MGQMSWRASDDLLDRVRRQASEHGRSLNEWVTLVLEAASDPSYASSEADRVRERLAAAGLLERPTGSSGKRPSRQALARARAEAGRGTPLSDLVASGRR